MTLACAVLELLGMSFARDTLFLSVVALWVASGCLDRPLVESRPSTSNVFVSQVTQQTVDKIDLLFMVDNSASMADKQEILRNAVPVLVSRLTSPICVDSVTRAPVGENSMQGKCTRGEPEFNPIADIHVGIVSSSLGAHGGPACADGPELTPNDRAHLLGSVRPTGNSADPKRVFELSRTWNNSGFLAWDANQVAQPLGSKDAGDFQKSFKDMISAAGQQGCGFEASLESWYRFLIDPEPPANVTKVTTGMVSTTVRGSKLLTNPDGSTTCQGCDLELLAQRKAFLRPDSLVAIVMLSDENDCSIRDDGVGWSVATGSRPMPRATEVCNTNPNDKCCRSCEPSDVAPAGCPALADDPVCRTVESGQQYAQWKTPGDSPNLRCYEQKRRFGVDLLYPTARYVEALTSPTLTLQSDGKTQVPNPLYVPGAQTGVRAKSLVFLAGIVGVPWQDIADEASLHGPGLKYLTSTELIAKDRWSLLLGKPDASPPVPPTDPFMIESALERSGTNPITHDPIVAHDAMSPTASPINGHEQNIPERDDLQYACTFQLASPKLCQPGEAACDCTAKKHGDVSAVVIANSPLCQPPGGGAATTSQSYAKAYPGTRELAVLKDLSEQGIVASICPKSSASADPASDPNYGYNPAVAAIIDRLKIELGGQCLPRAIQTDPETHQVLCKVIEAQASGCNCKLEGRAPADPAIAEAVQRQLHDNGRCGGDNQPACASFCQCEILQAQGPDLDACRLNQPSAAGFCYVDDPKSPLVSGCPVNEKRLLHFASRADNRLPAAGAFAYIACLGEPLRSADTDAGN